MNEPPELVPDIVARWGPDLRCRYINRTVRMGRTRRGRVSACRTPASACPPRPRRNSSSLSRSKRLVEFMVAAQIRADPALASTPFILATAFDRRALRDEALAAGCAAFLRKPVRRDELHRAVMQALACVDTKEPSKAPDGARPDLVSPDAGQGTAGSHDEHILVAEDNAVNQRLLLAQLRSLGYQAQAVANGHEVLEAMIHHRFALVLMDCHMPEMDGLETTRAIRAQEKKRSAQGQMDPPRIPVLALMADVLSENRAHCLEAGMDGFLTNPVRKEQLREALDEWLQRREATLN